MKKRLFSCLFTATVILSAGALKVGAATIDQDSNPKSATADILLNITPAYTVTIPEDTTIYFGDIETDFDSVGLQEAQLEVGKSVTVTVQAGALVNTDDAAKIIPFTVMAGGEKFTSAEYTAEGQFTDLTLVVDQADWDRAYAGSYEGTVTFIVAYGDTANP